MSLGSLATSALLACAAAACFRQSHARAGRDGPGNSRFWSVQAALLFALGLAHAFGVDDWLLHWGRQAVLASGLYSWRRPFQAALLLVGLLWAYRTLQHGRLNRRDSALARWQRLCAGGTTVIAVVFGARAVSLHGVDAALSHRILDLGLGRWVEWTCATLICTAALLHGRKSPAPQPALNAWKSPRV